MADASHANQSGLDPSMDRMMNWIEKQVSFGARRPGTEAGKANEDFLFETLQNMGLESVRKEAIEIQHWQQKQCELYIEHGDKRSELDSFAIPYCAFTESEGVRAPLRYVDSTALRQKDDWQGQIIVTEIRFPELPVALLGKISPGRHDPDDTLDEIDHPATWVRLGWHIYKLAAKRGALGFIGIVRDQPGGSPRMYAPYGFKEKNILDKPLPGVWVSKNDGEEIRQAARDGAQAILKIQGIAEPGVTHNIIGEIPGNDDSEAIVLSCHHDSPFESPVEDASGVAAVLELAHYFAHSRNLNRRLIILLSAGHFYGSIGTRTFIHKHRETLLAKVAAEITIEHIALEAAEDDSGKLVATGRPEGAGIFVPLNRKMIESVLEPAKEHDLRRIFLLPAESPLGAYPSTDGGDWHEAGVPLVNYISNPVYLLTDDDAMQWIDKPRLGTVVATFKDIITRLDNVSQKELAAKHYPLKRLSMKLLRRLSQAKSTKFGRHPVY